MSMFCLATTYRQREISYKSVSDIPVCPRLAAKVWWYGHDHTNFYVFYCTLQSHFQGASNIHARSDLIEAHSLVSTDIVLLAFSLKD